MCSRERAHSQIAREKQQETCTLPDRQREGEETRPGPRINLQQHTKEQSKTWQERCLYQGSPIFQTEMTYHLKNVGPIAERSQEERYALGVAFHMSMNQVGISHVVIPASFSSSSPAGKKTTSYERMFHGW